MRSVDTRRGAPWSATLRADHGFVVDVGHLAIFGDCVDCSTAPTPETGLAMTSPLLHLPGAVAGDGIDAPVAAHYGSFNGEQRALTPATASSTSPTATSSASPGPTG